MSRPLQVRRLPAFADVDRLLRGNTQARIAVALLVLQAYAEGQKLALSNDVPKKNDENDKGRSN